MKRALTAPEKHALLAQLHDFMREEGIPFTPATAVRPSIPPVNKPPVAAVAGTSSRNSDWRALGQILLCVCAITVFIFVGESVLWSLLVH